MFIRWNNGETARLCRRNYSDRLIQKLFHISKTKTDLDVERSYAANDQFA